MNISLLLYGSEDFFTAIPGQFYNNQGFSVELIGNLNQALSRLHIAAPDILLVQAGSDGGLELCAWLKEQTKLSWVYCILLEDRQQLHVDKNKNDKAWELEVSAKALKQGADAYIWYVADKSQSNLLEVSGTNAVLEAHIAVGLRKAQKYRELLRANDLLSSIALSDALTELNNRRALEWDLAKQIQKARAQGTSLSLIILDVDYFKKVNDTHGHLVGDRLLQLLCTRLRHNLRFQDTPYRYGGEEFVILLSNTACDEASVVAKRLNRVVREQAFAINNTLAVNATISLGATCLQPDDDPQGLSLLHRADQFLLEAKASGRNKVVSCEEGLSSVSHIKVVS
jgi:diguanylate cyclase (GGDEF)-like protein